ncbi:MAG: hypothetical protein PHQ81_02155 [Methanofollis sp.]|nr:hypothetical protein [Methanofollis sp.]
MSIRFRHVIEHIPELSMVEDLLELKCFPPEILIALLDRGACRPPDPRR